MVSKNFSAFSETVHIPTLLSRDQLSFSESNVNALIRWTGTLTLLKLGDTSEEILRALTELSELHCSETLRYDLIQALHPVVEHILETLDKLIIQQGPQHRDRQSHLIELSSIIRLYLIHIYLDIVYRSQQQLQRRKRFLNGFGLQQNLKTARVLASYYALQQLALLLVQQQKCYSHCLKWQWYSIHQLYRLARSNQEHLTNINLLQGSHYPLKHIQHAYMQILVLDIFNTYQIRPEEIEALLQCSSEWIKWVEISNKVSHLTRYMVDTQQDLPPCDYHKKPDAADQQAAHQNPNPDFNADYFISTQNLLEHINSTIQHDAKYMSEVENKYLSSALQFHIQNVLGTSHSQRRHQRYEASLQLSLCFSVQAAHFQLSSHATDHAAQQSDQHNNVAESSIRMGHAQQQGSLRAVAELQDLNAAKLPHDQLTSTYPGADPQPTAQFSFELDREAMQIHSAQVLDVSAYGYRIHWTQPQPKLLNTGEFILVRESPTQIWKAGVVRWMKKSVTQTYAIGLEVLAEHVLPCRLERRPFAAADLRHNPSQSVFFPSLILQQIRPEQRVISLVLPNNQDVDEYTNWVLHFSTDQIELVFKKILLITESFIQIECVAKSQQQQSKLLERLQSKATLTQQATPEAIVPLTSRPSLDHS